MTNDEHASKIVDEEFSVHQGIVNMRRTDGLQRLKEAISQALHAAEKRGEHTKLQEWEQWHHQTFGYTVTERAGTPSRK